MAKTRLNAEEAFMSIMGKTAEDQDMRESPISEMSTNKATEKSQLQETPQKQQSREKLVQTAFYITKKQHRALKIKAALGENPKDKDQSTIVRAALDAYLADTLKTLS